MKKYIDVLFAGVLAYCSIGLITGIVNMISFFEIINTKIMLSGGYKFIGISDQEIFLERSITLSIIAFICVCAVAFACIFSILKNGKAPQIVAIVISTLSIITSAVSMFAINNLNSLPKYNSYYSEYKSYYDFTIQQLLSDAAKSLFIPIIAVSVMLIIRAIVKKSTYKTDTIELSEEQEAQNG